MKEFKYLKKHKALTESKTKIESKTKVNENVLVVNDGEIFKVSKVIDVPKKLINSLLKKAKEETGKDPKIFWNDIAVADEIVKYIIETHLNADSLPASILMGDTTLGSQSIESDNEEELETGEEGIPDDLELDAADSGEEGEEELETEIEGEETDREDVPSLDSDVSDDEETEEAEEAEEEI